MKRRPTCVVCSIGSVDPTGAAGLTMDLQIYSLRAAVGVAVVTAVTAQNADRVLSVGAIQPRLIKDQLRAIWEQVTPDAICIGLLPTVAAINAVTQFLRRCRPRPPIVVDPVIAATSGRRFLGAREVRALRQLISMATVVTPNVAEASALAAMPVATLPDAERAARKLARIGCAVLVTGGDAPDRTCTDILALSGTRSSRLTSSRLDVSMRGAGGILAAAMAAELGRGARIDVAVARARGFVRRALGQARSLGRAQRAQFLAL